MTSSEIATGASNTATSSAGCRKGPSGVGVKATVMPGIHRIYYQLVTDSLLPSILQVLCLISQTKIFIRVTTKLLAFLQREEIQTRELMA